MEPGTFLHRLTGAHELPQAGSALTGEEFFAEPQREIRRRCGGSVAAPAAGAKRKDNLRFSFLFELLPFPCFLIWRRLPTCDRCETEGTTEDFFFRVFLNLFAGSDTVLLHRSATSIRRGMTVPRNSLTRYTAWHLRIKRLVQFIFVGPVHHNALTNCAARLCRTLR